MIYRVQISYSIKCHQPCDSACRMQKPCSSFSSNSSEWISGVKKNHLNFNHKGLTIVPLTAYNADTTWRCQFRILLLHIWSNSLQMCLGKKHKITQESGPVLPTVADLDGTLASWLWPGTNPAIAAFGEWARWQKHSLTHTLFLSDKQVNLKIL